MTKERVLLNIKKNVMVAVIRGDSAQNVVDISKLCIDSDITTIELTFTTPFVHRAIEQLKSEFGDKIIVGAGTVLDSETARIAILHGADFVVSPHLSIDVIKLCNRYRIAVMSGIMTVTEAISAMESGCDVLKVFPSEVLGIPFVKAVKAPLPYAELMPTGGVSANNIGDWLKAGVYAVGIGSSLTSGDIKTNAEHLISACSDFKGGIA